jgi:hypothetical protein
VNEANYWSGDEVVLEFVEHRYGFSRDDFRERVTAAAVRLSLVRAEHVDEQAGDDLVDLVATGTLREPRSGLGRYLVARWDTVGTRNGESLVYWLRKLVFRSAWLDQRLKLGMLDVSFDDGARDFRYHLPSSEPPLVDLTRHPSWRPVRYVPR